MAEICLSNMCVKLADRRRMMRYGEMKLPSCCACVGSYITDVALCRFVVVMIHRCGDSSLW